MIRALQRASDAWSGEGGGILLRRLAAVALLGLGGWWLVRHLPKVAAGRIPWGGPAAFALLSLTLLACGWLLWHQARLRRVFAVPLFCMALCLVWAAFELAIEVVSGRSPFALHLTNLITDVFFAIASAALGRLLWRGALPWQLPSLVLVLVGGLWFCAGLTTAVEGLPKGQFWPAFTLGTGLGAVPFVVGWLLWQHSRRQALLLAPPTDSDFFVIGGTLRHDAPCYVERRADGELYAALQRGEFCYVLTSRQMGKSSLMVRTAARLREDGVAVAVLDLTTLGQNLTAEQWYGGLLGLLGQSLGLEDELEAFWEERSGLGPLQRWTTALREVVLPQLGVRSWELGVGERPSSPAPNSQLPTPNSRLVIFVDEIDVVRSLPFTTDEFFAAIRACYNRRSEEPELARLTFCLLGVATPSDLIQDSRTTPFNIGRRIELTDFARGEVGPLIGGLRRKGRIGTDLMTRVLYWTGGHPYLTQRLCQAIVDQPEVKDAEGIDRLCQALFLTPGARDDNLQFVRDRLLKSGVDLPGVLDLYARVLGRGRVGDDETSPFAGHLRLSGITRSVSGCLQVRNRIYRRVFDRRWVLEHLPGAERRRQRAAMRRGLLIGAAAAMVIVLLGGEAARLARHAQRATQAARQAEQAAARAEAGLATSYENALMHLALGDPEGYRLASESTLARFGAVKKPESANLVAWTCALGPHAVADLNRPIQMAEAAVASAPKEYAYISTLGTCLYRAGRFEEAIRRLNAAITLQGKGGTAFEHLVLAMAHERLGHPDQARQALRQAVVWIRQNAPAHPRNGPHTWVVWTQHMELKLLRREAEALIDADARR